MTTFVRAPYNYDADVVSEETGLECLDLSKAQQNQKDESDINNIVRRFGLTGELPLGVRPPQYGDFTSVTDYQTALNAVLEADRVFMMMPYNVRQRFNNSPEEFVDFCSNPENIDEMVKLGLAVEKEAAKPEPATPVPAPAATPPQAGG